MDRGLLFNKLCEQPPVSAEASMFDIIAGTMCTAYISCLNECRKGWYKYLKLQLFYNNYALMLLKEINFTIIII